MSDTGHQDLNVRHFDRRIARTLTAVVGAFTELARVQPVEDIAVKDLVDRAGIGRSTFYDHFDSVESLLLWLVDELIRWASNDAGEFELEELLRFVAEVPEVAAAFLQVESCARRCEVALAIALDAGESAASQFAAAGVMGSLRTRLAQDPSPPIEDFVARTCDLVTAVLAEDQA